MTDGLFCDDAGVGGFRGFGGLSQTPIQHNYPNNPFGSRACRISQFFDHPTPYGIHHAEDVVYDNGHKTGGVDPSYGATVYAADAGKVTHTTTDVPLSSWPSCESQKGLHPADDIVIYGTDGYYTVYVEVSPLPGIAAGVTVGAGEPIGEVAASGCESGPHVHIQRQNASGKFFNFTLPCTNSSPTKNFWDGLVNDLVDDSNP